MHTANEPSSETSPASTTPEPSAGNLPTTREPTPAFETIESAAKRLGVDAVRLRERCRREGRCVGDCTIAFLGDDVVAFKFGRRWRVRFKEPPAAARRGST